MTHWLILPIVLPAMLAAFMVLAARYHLLIQRVLSVTGTLGLLALALGLFWQASDGTVSLYQLGNWAAPFGIVLVADRLSTLMVLLTCVLAVPVLLYAIGSGWDNRGRHFHPLFQFQLMGILGAFLTGDAFNLFVFFEVLLIASYGLMIHAGGQRRLRAGTQYVLYNLLGSTLFLFALGTIYAETGTLNMADLAMRVATLDAGDGAGIRVAAVLLLLVFAVKAAILPLHFWLPASYSEAPAPVAALFAIMTKVGAYCIIRFYTLVFPPDLEITQGLFDVWLMPAALLTVALGMAGVLGAKGRPHGRVLGDRVDGHAAGCRVGLYPRRYFRRPLLCDPFHFCRRSAVLADRRDPQPSRRGRGVLCRCAAAGRWGACRGYVLCRGDCHDRSAAALGLSGQTADP